MPEDDDRRLHALFQEFRAQVYEVVEGFSASVLDRIERERDRERGPGLGHLVGSALVELANVLSSATGHDPDADDPLPRDDATDPLPDTTDPVPDDDR